MIQKNHVIDGEFMTFDLDHEEYAVALDKVLEILGTEGIQDSDKGDPCVRGVIHIRNQNVPVLDLRCQFGLGANMNEELSAVLLTVFGPGLSKIGLLVDSIRQVIRIKASIVKKAMNEKNDPRVEFILGQVEVEGRTIILLNLDKWGQSLQLNPV
jgi:purine-binding chemotaxis protein CheW